jgi:hypothetical protein
VRAALAIAVALAVSACSFTMIERLPTGYHVEQTPRCSRPWTPIVGDSVLFVFLGAVLARGNLPALAAAAPEEKPAEYRATAILAAVVATTVVSAVWGVHERGRCERARSAHQQWLGSSGAPVSP